MKFSLVISTKGRTDELRRLIRSLRDQTLRDFEVVLSDQNEDDRLIPVVKELGSEWNLIYLRSAGGASRGRNLGIARATGDILCFPDDDSVYPPTLLEQVADFFQNNPQYGYLSGRSFADDGKDSVSRHARHASPIHKMTVHAQCIEFAMFIRRSRLGDLRFDENMGPGSPDLWQCDEGPDLMLRLEEAGVRGYYDPRFGVWHARPVTCYNAKDIHRTYRYGCANGYFYRKHHYPGWYFYYQMGRSFCGLLLGLGTLKMGKVRLYLARLRGRWVGWTRSSAQLPTPPP
jgi:glycosyltransferase involved in cell wall biosynthesis